MATTTPQSDEGRSHPSYFATSCVRKRGTPTRAGKDLRCGVGVTAAGKSAGRGSEKSVVFWHGHVRETCHPFAEMTVASENRRFDQLPPMEELH